MKFNKNYFLTFISFLFSLESICYSNNDSIEYKIGQMLMFGIGDVNSVEGADSLLLELSKNHLGGIILFEKNVNQYDSYNNLKKLILHSFNNTEYYNTLFKENNLTYIFFLLLEKFLHDLCEEDQKFHRANLFYI